MRHLTEALEDSRNRNIALTGRYGAGKSSVLDRFVADQNKLDKNVLRISISTLGPDNDEDLTNRIQKELVKQLLYRAKPGEIRRSRFARPKPLTWWRALLESAGATAAIVGLLWLFGLWPVQEVLGVSDPTLVAAMLFTVTFVLLVLGVVWSVRWLLGDRLVSKVSTAGLSIQLEKKADSYFDAYLDEIVAFFETTNPDIVVFEDLDRFDDARIFDSLRELNTLLNASAHWSKRKDRPLRFIYAIKDSIFEKIGKPQAEKDRAGESGTPGEGALAAELARPADAQQNSQWYRTSDIAAAETERANRTKFFEIVVPIVPFLSHNNSRDLLSDCLEEGTAARIGDI